MGPGGSRRRRHSVLAAGICAALWLTGLAGPLPHLGRRYVVRPAGGGGHRLRAVGGGGERGGRGPGSGPRVRRTGGGARPAR